MTDLTLMRDWMRLALPHRIAFLRQLHRKYPLLMQLSALSDKELEQFNALLKSLT